MKREDVKPSSTVETIEFIKIGYSLDIKPIIEKNCTGCHNESSSIPNWENSEKLKEYALKESSFSGFSELQSRLRGKKLPQMPWGATPLSDSDLAKIDAWISQGASIE